MKEKKSGELFPRQDESELEDKFKNLVKPFKVIRDPVHGDIWISKTEKDIIDTPIFQRLRRVRQLGPTHMVYPGATHTRFEHSIGVLYVTQRIIEAINKNYDRAYSEKYLLYEEIYIARLVALLHDLAHMSFGHTLEDEGKLFEDKQWTDRRRRSKLLKIINPIIERHLEAEHIPEDKIRETLKEIEDILVAEEKGEDSIKELKRPFIADIIGDTICADLMDYLKRDSYFLGLSLAYDKRLISYFVIKKYEREARAAILLERRQNVIRHDILSYCVDLLRLRYSLAEKAYYHRVKVIFSAMVIKMVHRALEANIVTVDDIFTMGDDVLLWKISHSDIDSSDKDALAAKTIAKDILERKIYKDVYFKPYELSTHSFEAIVEQYRDKYKRYALEDSLGRIFTMENLCEISPAGFVVYVSKKENLEKPASTKVFIGSYDPQVWTLQELTHERDMAHIGDEIDAINASYQSLWQFHVLLNPEDYQCLDNLGISPHLIERAIDDVLRKNAEGVVEIRSVLLEKRFGQAIPWDRKQQVAKKRREFVPKEDWIGEIDKELLR